MNCLFFHFLDFIKIFSTGLKEKVTALLDKEEVLFVPSGEMANLVCSKFTYVLIQYLIIFQNFLQNTSSRCQILQIIFIFKLSLLFLSPNKVL